MRVAYFDLGYSREQYGLQPTRYGGGAVAARYLKEDPEVDFHVFAPQEAFENIGSTERVDRCHAVDAQMCGLLRQGLPLSLSDTLDHFDIVLHPHTCATINRGSFKGPIVHFCGFDGSAGHPGNDYVLLYDPSFRAQFGERAKYVRIGKPVPEECPDKWAVSPTPERPFVFQCSRHDDHMNSIETARQAKAMGIPVVFAGPIHGSYPLLERCDGQLIRYVGEINEATKLDYCRRAALYVMLHAWDTMPFNQSIVEAQGQGTPIYTYPKGPFLSTYLKHGQNGFDANRCSLTEALEQISPAMRVASWQAARQYDVSVMTTSFKQAFREIVDEWSVRNGTSRECI